MKRLIWISGGALLLSAFGACEPYLSLDEALEGKRCPCAPGYTCNEPLQICESLQSVIEPSRPATAGVDGGTGGAESAPVGSAGAPAAGGAGAEPSGSAGADAVEPVGGSGGAPGAAGAASTGEEPPPDPPGTPDAGCVPVPLYRDRDGDGFGGTAQGDLDFGCPPLEGFATVTGDCHDVEPTELDPAGDVFPGQSRFFGFPYPTENGLSFDYDCSGNEVAEQHDDFVPAPSDCEQRQSCGLDIGYRPAPPRAGQDVNVLCGSVDSVVCTGSEATGCALASIPGNPFRCH